MCEKEETGGKKKKRFENLLFCSNSRFNGMNKLFRRMVTKKVACSREQKDPIKVVTYRRTKRESY